MAYLPPKVEKKCGYHIKNIQKQKFGTIGKILEEVQELEDAHNQNCKIMMINELSDLYGAIKGFLSEKFPDITMTDLEKMSDINDRVFKNGLRD